MEIVTLSDVLSTWKPSFAQLLWLALAPMRRLCRRETYVRPCPNWWPLRKGAARPSLARGLMGSRSACSVFSVDAPFDPGRRQRRFEARTRRVRARHAMRHTAITPQIAGALG